MNVIIVGAGSVAQGLAQRLTEEDHQVALIIENTQAAEQLAAQFPRALVIRGPGTDEMALKHAQAQDCDAFFAVEDNDSHAMVACLLARERFKIPCVVALSTACEDSPAFSALSINCVCGPDVLVDALLAEV